MKGRFAVFLDRDGTLNRDIGHLRRAADVEVLPGVGGALRELQAEGALLVVITNQSAIARGIATGEEVDLANERLLSLLRDDGISIDALYLCPHHPEFDGECSCRKPEPGLLLDAARSLGIDLARSFLVGDKFSDIEAGRRAGVKTVLLATGHGSEEIRRGPREGEGMPDHVAPTLGDAVRWILEERSRDLSRGEPPPGS